MKKNDHLLLQQQTNEVVVVATVRYIKFVST